MLHGNTHLMHLGVCGGFEMPFAQETSVESKRALQKWKRCPGLHIRCKSLGSIDFGISEEGFHEVL